MKIRTEIVNLIAQLDKDRDKAGWILNNIKKTKEAGVALEIIGMVRMDLKLLCEELNVLLKDYDYPNTPINDEDIQ